MRRSITLTSRPSPNVRRNPASVKLNLLPSEVLEAAAFIRSLGSNIHTNLVGGAVVDMIQGVPPKDHDIEVYGIAPDALQAGLARRFKVSEVGRAFGVLKVRLPSGADLDVSLPRRDSRTGTGHRGFTVAVDPNVSFADAARRRDFTINAISVDLATGAVIDPFNGVKDLQDGVLRAVDPVTFVEDPLRALRAVQLLARKAKTVDLGTKRLIRDLVPAQADLPAERVFEEWRKLLLKSKRPSMGLELMNETGLLDLYPELAATRGVPQRDDAHPEGDVWEHTKQSADIAASLRDRLPEEKREALMFAALLHDVGKAAPGITVYESDVKAGKFPADRLGTAYGHDQAGEPLATAFLERMRAPKKLTKAVGRLVHEHMQPLQMGSGGAKASAYDRLARKLEEEGADLDTLYYLTMSDSGGRTPGGAVQSEERLYALALEESARRLGQHIEEMKSRPAALTPLVQGRDLIAMGVKPGPTFKPLLDYAMSLQDQGMGRDEILAHVKARAAG
jgi:tRNA nucleotidyltransferase (CCA-adding enzyme)